MLPAWVVRRVWDDPRDLVYVLNWNGRQDRALKERVRIYRNTRGSNPSGADSVEIMFFRGGNVEVCLEWRPQPHGGRSLMLRCTRCQRPCRALYGSRVGVDGRYYVVKRARWHCRQCAGLRYSSEGGALVLRGSVLTKSLMRPCSDFRISRPRRWLPNGT
jgi:hypothetical protein